MPKWGPKKARQTIPFFSLFGIEAHLAVRGKATADKVEDLLELTHAILADANEVMCFPYCDTYK